MIDNLKYNREQARKAKEDPTHGFAYAIKPNGSLLGDEAHAKRKRQRQQSGSRFTFMSSQEIAALPRGRHAPLHPPPHNCLAQINQLIQQATVQYQQLSMLPPEPKEPLPNTNRKQKNPIKPYPNTSQQPQIQATTTHNSSSKDSSNHTSIQAQATSVSNPCNSKVTSSSAPASQPRKENRHPNQNNPYSNTSNNQNPTNAANNTNTIVIDDDVDDDEFMDANDDYDALLANFDVDEAVRGRHSTESSNTNGSGATGSFDYGNLNWGDANQSSNSNFGNGNQNPGFQNNRNQNNSFDTNQNGPVSFSVNQYNDHDAGHNENNNYSSNSATGDHSGGNFDNNTSNYGNDYQNDYANSYRDSNRAMDAGQNNGNAPLCAEHNLPCRLLTANTASNMGRQFYKCSLPEGQQCDHFEWADGTDGNWNESVNGASANGEEPKDTYVENQRIFGHRFFRPGQKEVISKAIEGRDVFVLMPTGGGKSLCYQLPAWCCPGLAVVISPLLSLIQDQVQSMTKVGVQSVFLSSKQDYDTEQREITERLGQLSAHGGIKILYLTPEKLTHSNQMKRILRRLYQRGLLSRFVVDEAHCLSDWGHDFRPDYNNLGMLRREFPNTPLMALTATANEKVVNDAIRALGMRNHHLYRSSFNRKNLHYEVRKKDGKVVEAIADYIASRPRESGVVYCLSRRNCEDVSEKLEKILRQKGHRSVRVSYYHAELDQRERDRRHHAWSIGQISVLCATIAFGMGIDKPDVRYVIHYSMPKSITHYYQESGRAGRDGDQADCILFYHYKDKKTLENMIRKSSNNPNSASTRRKIDQLYTCVRYCEDEFRCRRTMQLEFFGENFDRRKCNGTCDNCKAGRVPDRRDTTKVAQQLLQILTQAQNNRLGFRGSNVTMNQVADLYRGAKNKSVTEGFKTGRIQGYGSGSKMKKFEIDRILHAMVFERLVVEESAETTVGFAADYLQLGENAQAVLHGGRKFFVEFPSANKTAKNKSAKASSKTTSQAKKKNAVPKAAKGKRKSPSSANTPSPVDGLKFAEGVDTSDEEIEASSSFSNFRASDSQSVLNEELTQSLYNMIRKVINLWALEEQALGNNIHYWNIMSTDVIKSIASYCPTSEAELAAHGVLGEAKLKEYGSRLIQVVQRFLSQKDISVEYVRNKRPVKRPKLGAKEDTKTQASQKKMGQEVITINDQENDEFDEFDTGIDFDAIEIPEAASAASSAKKSHYFP